MWDPVASAASCQDRRMQLSGRYNAVRLASKTIGHQVVGSKLLKLVRKWPLLIRPHAIHQRQTAAGRHLHSGSQDWPRILVSTGSPAAINRHGNHAVGIHLDRRQAGVRIQPVRIAETTLLGRLTNFRQVNRQQYATAASLHSFPVKLRDIITAGVAL